MVSFSVHSAPRTAEVEVTRVSGGAFRRILVGFDGTKAAREALRAAVGIAGELGGEVRVLLVVRPSARVETPEELARLAVAERDQLSRELEDDGGAGIARLDRRVAFSVDPARAVAQHAEEHGFDLIVVSSHGDAGVDAAVATLVERHPCPVLVV